MQTFIQAAQSGDWKTVGTTIAAGIWGAMGDEQRKRVKSVASDLLGRLSKELKSQASSLLNTAATIGKNLVNNLNPKSFGKGFRLKLQTNAFRHYAGFRKREVSSRNGS